MRVLAIDLGSKRIGVAVSDPTGTLATPVTVVQRSGDEQGDHRRLVALVDEWEAAEVVVGLPIDLRGEIGPAAQGVLAEVERLGDVCPVPIHLYDERLTTRIADRRLQELELDGRARRKVVDKVAAAVLLQAWLDRDSAEGGVDGPLRAEAPPGDPG
ncbi:MAG: Holliday junction resolvase RuvX [Acidimicrobiia bacterium]|nr:Holliday junction resolvase RuvX [Acidimicrobiia bacterium]